MMLSSTLFRVLLSITLVTGHLLTDDRTTRRPRKGDPAEGRIRNRQQRSVGSQDDLLTDDRTTRRPRRGDPAEGRILNRQQRSVGSQDDEECLAGWPVGSSYTGRQNVTISGRTCQVWAESEPHVHGYPRYEHNYCRKPPGHREDRVGVFCYTTDPDVRWELCSVPFCNATYNCQDWDFDGSYADALGSSYFGGMNVTKSGRTCQVWADSPHPGVGEHNHCRNPNRDIAGRRGEGVWCHTTDPDKEYEYCDVPMCAPKNSLKVFDFFPFPLEWYVRARLQPGPLPESFTICGAFMLEAWVDVYTENLMFRLLDDDRFEWL